MAQIQHALCVVSFGHEIQVSGACLYFSWKTKVAILVAGQGLRTKKSSRAADATLLSKELLMWLWAACLSVVPV